MPREKETYREHLLALREKFPGAEMVSLRKAASYVGVDSRTLQADKTFPCRAIGGVTKVSIINLARWLAC